MRGAARTLAASARAVGARLHRWVGLGTAGFLLVAGLTGAVIAWDHELDAWLAPRFHRAAGAGAPRAPLALADALERRDPRLSVTYLPLAVPPGRTLVVGVSPRTDPATGQPFALGFDQLAVHPVSGELQGRRTWGAAALRREAVLPFLYRLHYSLHLPGTWGVLLMGLVGLAWTLDAFVALWISFPSLAAWRRSFAFRWREGGVRLLFDVHRSGGVWAWGLLLALAVTSVSMNLGDQVVRPVVGLLSPLTPHPLAAHPAPSGAGPVIARAEALARAQAEAARRGVKAPAGALWHAAASGLMGVGFFAPGAEHGDGGLGNPWIWIDDRDGRVVAAQLPGEGSAGDVFMQAQFPIHSGRILGVGGRIAVSALGVVVAALGATGVALWARRLRRRAMARAGADVVHAAR